MRFLHILLFGALLLAACAAASAKSLLVVAGDNYEEFHTFRHYIDPAIRQSLEKDGWVVGECSWDALTEETLSRFQAVIFLQTPDTFIKADKDARLGRMQALLQDYLARGGGVLVFPDLFRGTVHKTVNAWLEPYGIKALPQTIQETPRGQHPFEAYPAMGVASTGNIARDALTEGVSRFVYPEGNELTTTFQAGDDWKVLVRGEKTALSVPNEGVVESDPLFSEEPPIVAVREAGGGRMAYWSGHSSFFILKPYHAYWDEGRVLKEGDDLRLLENLLAWLAGSPASQLGGFTGEEQTGIFHFEQARERTISQEQRIPGPPRRGVIGLQSRLSGGPLSVADLCTQARQLGLDYVVFTEDAAAVSSADVWEDYVKACAEASGPDFIAFPGVLVESPETHDRAVVFNLRKPWPETPWNVGDFESFVRIGVNNAWRAFFALIDPDTAPVPLANQGAVNALAVNSSADEAQGRPAAAGIFQRTQREMWGLAPIRYRQVRTEKELTDAADTGTTWLYSEKWGSDFRVSQDEITFSAVADGPVLKDFSASGESTWTPPFSSRYRGRVEIERLAPGQVVELWFGQNRMRAVTAQSASVAFPFSFVAEGSGHLFVRVLDQERRTILQASALKFAKVRFNSFVGSDRMNGYWYPVREARPDTPGSIFIEGKYGVIGTSVYPQLAWGDHWQFRSENQSLSEPLGFEVGAPPGSIERMWAGFYLKTPAGWESLAPWRGMSYFSSDAAVWTDSPIAQRTESKVNGRKEISVEPSSRLDRKTDVTGFRWDEHAILWVSAEAVAREASLPEARVLALRLGDSRRKFSTRSILRASGELEKSDLPLGQRFRLHAGDGFSLGDMPMGMVSIWALQDLDGNVSADSDRAALELFLPAENWPPAIGGRVTASYLVVISRHQSGKPRELLDVRDAVFSGNFWQTDADRKKPAADGISRFRQLVSLGGGVRSGWGTWSRPGRSWRAEIRDFAPGSGVGILSRSGDGWTWRQIETAGERGMVFMEETPKERAFLGQPILCDIPSVKIELGSLDPQGKAWKVSLHNPTDKPVSTSLRVHPALAGIVGIDDPACTVKPGETLVRTLELKPEGR